MKSLLTKLGFNRATPPTIDWEAKYKAAITDLAAAQDEIAALKPDAEAMRAKRKRDRELKAEKAKAAPKAAPKKAVRK